MSYNLPMIRPTEWEKVLSKYDTHPQELDLISKILVYEPKERLTPL